MTHHVHIKNVSVKIDSHTIVENLSLQLDKGEIGCLLGPSGCGKTTLQRAIAGFEDLSQGEIFLAGKCISKESYTQKPEKNQKIKKKY